MMRVIREADWAQSGVKVEDHGLAVGACFVCRPAQILSLIRTSGVSCWRFCISSVVAAGTTLISREADGFRPVADAGKHLVAYNFYKDVGLPVESSSTLAPRAQNKNRLVNYYAPNAVTCARLPGSVLVNPASFGLKAGDMPTGKRRLRNYRLAGQESKNILWFCGISG